MPTRHRVSLLAIFVLFSLLWCEAQTSGKPPYLDPSQPIESRVDDLIKRMSLEQKAQQLVNQARAIPGSGCAHIGPVAGAQFGDGVRARVGDPNIGAVKGDSPGIHADGEAAQVDPVTGAKFGDGGCQQIRDP